jgi:hypothetical protein
MVLFQRTEQLHSIAPFFAYLYKEREKKYEANNKR